MDVTDTTSVRSRKRKPNHKNCSGEPKRVRGSKIRERERRQSPNRVVDNGVVDPIVTSSMAPTTTQKAPPGRKKSCDERTPNESSDIVTLSMNKNKLQYCLGAVFGVILVILIMTGSLQLYPSTWKWKMGQDWYRRNFFYHLCVCRAILSCDFRVCRVLCLALT